MRKGYFKRIFFTFLLLFAVIIFCSSVSIAQNNLQLAEQYSPILYFEAEETCWPVDADYHISNSERFCIDDTDETSCFYDNPHGTIDNDGVIQHYQSVMNSDDYPPTVYYRIGTKSSNGVTNTYIQYWIFYAFNKGELNQHEGDWELVEVLIPETGDKWVGYSQHYSGQSAKWNQVETEGDHIKVYVARGSHANYLRSYSGKLGFANDFVGDNGKIWRSGNNYQLVDITTQTSWINFEGRWGEVGDSLTDAISGQVLGQIGPEGPQYRANGDMWNEPIDWANNLQPANDLMFTADWFFYNFVTIFVLTTALSLAITIFFIYRRHKKFGLGPRKVSMLYIDGANLKSIGNILCFVAIVLVIIGLFSTWYSVSFDASAVGYLQEFTEGEITDIMKIDGINGLQVVYPGSNGFQPMSSVALPFSLIIGIGIVFLVIASIGIHRSRKLGYKYIWKGIRILIPIILILVVILALGGIVPSSSAQGTEEADFTEILHEISSSPFGGKTTYLVPVAEGIQEPLIIEWGLGFGAQMLLLSGIIFIVAGVLEFTANKEFFTPKVPIDKKVKKQKKKDMQPTPVPPPQQPVQPQKRSGNFCPKCGQKLDEGSKFCGKCGEKIE